MEEKIQTIQTYDDQAQAMAQKFMNMGESVREHDVERAFSLVGKDRLNVLEIGCGNGREAKQILKRTNKYLGIDLSEELIKIARTYVPEANFEVADLEIFEFPKGLDIIFSFASLLHSDKKTVERVMQRAHESLNNKGIVYISLKTGPYSKQIKTDQFGTRTFYYYEPKDLIGLVPGLVPVWEDHQELRGQKWFTLVLQKTPS